MNTHFAFACPDSPTRFKRFVKRLYRLLVREPTSGQRLGVTMVSHTAVSFVLEPPPPSKHLLVNMYLLSK